MPFQDVQIVFGAEFTAAERAFDAYLNSVRRKTRAVNVGAGGFERYSGPLGRITGQAKEFQKSLEAANARVLAFGASAGVLFTIQRGFQKMVESMIEVEKSITNINVLLQVSSSQIGRFSNELFEVANKTGTSFFDAAEAAQEFARQGLGAEETLKRTRSAMELTRLSGLELSKSVSSITSAIEGFNDEALTSEEIINRLAAVDAKFAVSSADLAESLSRVGSSASDAKVGFNELIAIVTAARQATGRSGAVIGNSLKTIFTRLQRPQVLEDLEAIGVATKSASGASLDAISIAKNLANAYERLSESQRSFATEAVGGVYQINILKAILKDLGNDVNNYKLALDSAEGSSGFAQKRISELNKTLSSQIQIFRNDFTKAFANIGNIVLKPTISGGTEAIDRFFKVLGKIGSGNSGDNIIETSGIKSIEVAAKTIGAIFSGPGIQFGVLIILKLLNQFRQFAIESTRDLTGLGQASKKRELIEQGVRNKLAEQADLMGRIFSGSLSTAKAAEEIAKQWAIANAQARTQENIIKNITAILARTPGIRLTPRVPESRAGGHIPNLNAEAERAGAIEGGYRPGAVRTMNIPQMGMVYYNTAETVKKFPHLSQPAIMPPMSSKAGMAYKQKFIDTHGFDPYKAEGLVPKTYLHRTHPELIDKIIKEGFNLSNFGYTGKRLGIPKDSYLTRDDPAGIFANELPPNFIINPTNYAKFVTFQNTGVNNPFRIRKYDPTLSVKAQISKTFGNKKGFELREALLQEGFDFIDTPETSEKIFLSPEKLRMMGVFKSQGNIPNLAITGRGLANRTIMDRLKAGAERGQYFSNFYDEYEKHNPLSGSSRELFNKIYASQSYGGVSDKLVFNKAIDIFRGHQQGQTDFTKELHSLGHKKSRPIILSRILQGLPLETPKTGVYARALSGDRNAVAVDANLINTALGDIGQGKLANSFRQRLTLLTQKIAQEMGMDPRAVQAAVFAGNSKFNPSFDHFARGFERLGGAAGGLVPNLARKISSLTAISKTIGPMDYENDVLKIDQFFSREKGGDLSKIFLQLSSELQKSGINKIDAGAVIGPKMVPLIAAARKRGYKIKGFFFPLKILQQNIRDRKKSDMFSAGVTTPKTTNSILKAFKSLGVSSDYYNMTSDKYNYPFRMDDFFAGLIPNLALSPEEFFKQNEGLLKSKSGREKFVQLAQKMFPQSFASAPTDVLAYESGYYTSASVTQAEKALAKLFGFDLMDDDMARNFAKSKASIGRQVYDVSGSGRYFSKSFLTTQREINVNKLEEAQLAGLQPSISVTDILKKHGFDPKTATGADLRAAASKEFPNAGGYPGFFVKDKFGLQGANIDYGGQGLGDRKLSSKQRNNLFIQKLIPNTNIDTPEFRVDIIGTPKGAEVAGVQFKGSGRGDRLGHVSTPIGNFADTPEARQAVELAKKAVLNMPADLRSGVLFGVDAFPTGVIETNPTDAGGTSGGTINLLTSLLAAKGLRENRAQRISDFQERGVAIASLKDRGSQQKSVDVLNQDLQSFRHDEFGYYKSALELAKQGYYIDVGSGKRRRKLDPNAAIKYFNKLGVRHSGLIPNLFINDVIDALDREDRATGGHAILSQSSKLVSARNPFGLAAIDRRSQKSADDAINQHKAIGQSMSQIKTAKSSSGLVPNLVIGTVATNALGGSNFDSSILDSLTLAFLQFGLGLQNAQKPLEKIGRASQIFLSAREKEIVKQREWLSSIDQARERIRSGSVSENIPIEPGSRNKRTVRSEQEIINLEKDPIVSKTRETISKLDADRTRQTERIRSAAFRGTFASSLAGGIASTALGDKDIGAGLEKFFTGLTTSAQILTAFQGKLGQATAAGVGAFALFDALDTYSKGLISTQKNYNSQIDKIQKTASALDNLSSSVNRLDNIYLSSTTSLETINKEYQVFQSNLDKLRATGPDGSRVAINIETASSSTEKQQRIAEARSLVGRQKEFIDLAFAIKSFGAARTSFFGVSGTALSTDGSKDSKEQISSIFRESAGLISSSLSEDTRKNLLRNVTNPEQFNSILQSTDKFKEVSEYILAANKGDKAKAAIDTAVLQKFVLASFGRQAASQDPSVKAVREAAIASKAAAEAQLSSALNQQANLERMLLNFGSFSGANELSLKGFAARGRFNVLEQDITRRTGAQQNQADFSGPITNAFREGAINVEKILLEKNQEISGLGIKASEGIINIIRDSASGLLSKSGSDEIGSIPKLNPNKELALNKLNEGIVNAVKSGELTKSLDSGNLNGLKDFLIDQSGLAGQPLEELKGVLTPLLSNEKVIELLNAIRIDVGLSSEKAAQQVSLAQIQAKIAEEGIRKQKEAGAFGGTNILEDRGARRKFERDFNRSLRQYQEGATPEIRGRGALGLLKIARDSNANIDETIPQFKALLDTAAAGVDNVISKALKGAKGTPVAQGDLGGFLLNNIALNTKKTGGLAVRKEFRPETVTNRGQAVLDSGGAGLRAINAAALETKTALDKSIKNIEGFADSVGNIREKLETIKNEIEGRGGLRESFTRAEGDAQSNVEEALTKAFEKLGLTLNTNNDTLINSINQSANKSSLTKTIAGGAVTASVLLQGGKTVFDFIKNFRNRGAGGAPSGPASLPPTPPPTAPPTPTSTVPTPSSPKVLPKSSRVRLNLPPASTNPLKLKGGKGIPGLAITAGALGLGFLGLGSSSARASDGQSEILGGAEGGDLANLIGGYAAVSGGVYAAGKLGTGSFIGKTANALFKPGNLNLKDAFANRSKFLGGTGKGGLGGGGLGFKGSLASVAGLAAFDYVSGGLTEEGGLQGIDSALGYASLVPGAAAGATTARAGLRVGNEAYKRNIFGSQTAADKFANIFYGNTGTNKQYEEQAQRQDLEAFNYANLSLSDPNEARKQDLREAITRGQKIRDETTYDTFRKSGRSEGDYQKFKDRENERINALIEQLKKLEQNGIKVNEDTQNSQQNFVNQLASALSQSNSPQPINITISVKDADRLPEIFNSELIIPLKDSLEQLKKRVAVIDNRSGNPQPPVV